MKKDSVLITTIIVSLVLIILLPNIVMADTIIDYGNQQNISWYLYQSGELKITGTGTISFSGAPPWNNYFYQINSVVIEEGITSISRDTFSNPNISSVSLPSTLMTIGSSAFYGCSQITSITIPQNISSIDSYAFGDCPNLSVVYYSGTKEEWGRKTIHSSAFPSTATIHTSEHNPGEAGYENEVAATCSTEGSYDEVIRCTVCGEIISSTHKTIPALNHTLTKEDAVAPSCTEPGHIEGWTCGNCNKHFTDETGNIEITEESWVIPPNHNWRAWSQTTAPTCTEKGVQTRTCFNCDASETEEIQATGHNFEHHDAEPATCTTAGNSEYWICGTCGNCFSDAEGNTKITANSWVINKLGHNMTPNPAVAATCTTAGNSAYWSCDRCNKYFSDAYGENEIGENSWIINKLRHSLISHPAVVATCTTAGNSEYWTCETCGKHFSDAEGNTEISANSWIINKLGHNMTAHSAADATCTTAGNSAYWSCDQCQKHFSDENGNNEIEADSWKIGALGHDMTGHSAVDATCTTAGNSAYWSCGRCGKYFNDAEGNTEIAADSWVISATGHSWSVWSQTTLPTCTEKGEEKRTCSNCDAYETKEIPAAGHALTKTEAKTASCTEAGNSAFWTCGTCDKYFSDAEGNTKIDADSWIISATGHALTKTEARTASCTEAGNSAYWTCGTCDKYFSDAEGNTEIDADSWIISAKGHNWNAWSQTTPPTCTEKGEEKRTCSNCDAYETKEISVQGHALTKTEAKTASCTEAGTSAYWSCDRCDKYFSDAQGTIEIEADSWISGTPLGHQMTEHPAVGATCVKPGNSAYRSCSRCGGFFSDAGGETAIEENSWVIAASGHSMQATAAKEATCTTDGNSAYWYCETCGIYYSDAEGKTGINENSWIIPMTGHRMTETPAGEATCTEAATCACWTCETCGKTFSDANGETEIDENSRMIGNPLGHRMTKHPAVSATCETPGNSVYWSCDRCGKFFSDEQGNTEIGANSWIIAAGHVPAKPVIENEIPATCTDGGSYEEVVLCSICSTELSRTSKTTEAVGHTPEARAAVKATCTAAGTKAYWECNTCHRKFSDEACTAEIDYAVPESALGHQWGKTTYTWSNDYQQVTAERRCSRDAAHTQKETVGTDAEVTAEATYDAPGSKTYTTRPFANADFVQQTKTVEIPKLDRTTGTGTEQPGQPGQPDQDPGNPPQDPGQQDQDPGNPPQDPGQQDQEPGNPPQNPGQQDQEPGNPPQDPEQQDQESGDPQQQDPEPPDQESKDPQQPESEQPQTQEPEQPQDPEPEQPQPEQTQPEQPQPAPESPQQQEQPQSEPPQTQPQPELPQTLPEEQPPQQEQQPEQEQPKAPTRAPAGSFTDPATGRYNIDADGNATFKSPAEDKANASIPDTINVSGFSVPVTKIDNNAFANSKQLETVTIGRNVKTIGSKAFSGCIKLKTVKGAANVEEIGKSAFASDKALKSVPKFPKLKKIGNNAFKGCTSLTKIIIGKSVIYIGKNAFNGCANLKTINIKSARLTGNNVKSGAFKGIFAKGTIKCPKSVIKEYKQFLPKKGVPKTVTIK